MNTGLRYLLAFSIPLLGTLLLTPLAGRLAHKLDILDHPQQHKIHREATPYLGGLAVAGGLLLVIALTTGASRQLITILAGALAMSLLGLVDDWRGVGPIVKLSVEAAAATALWFVGVRAGLFGNEIFHLALTIAWVIAVTNAVNMLDNMDGVAPGVAAISALGFFAIAAYRGDYLVASLALAVAGACIGFLRYNFPPARIFMGDAGSLLLGFLLAALGLKLDLVGETGVARGMLIPALLLAVPLFDMAMVVVARTWEGRPVYLGGTDHTAHRLARRGISPRGVAIAAYAVQAACCVLAFGLNQASHPTVVIAAAVAAAVALGLLGAVLGMATPEPSGDETVVLPDPVGRLPASQESSRETPSRASSSG